MSIGYNNNALRCAQRIDAQKIATSPMTGFTAIKINKQSSQHESDSSARKWLGADRGRVIRNRDCVVVWKQ